MEKKTNLLANSLILKYICKTSKVKEANDTEINVSQINKTKKEPFIFKLLLTFSAYSNLNKIFTINKIEGQLDCLHAIRG